MTEGFPRDQIRPVEPSDRAEWQRLWLAYLVFYESALGRAYFTPVGVGHRRLVPLALSRMVSGLAEGG